MNTSYLYDQPYLFPYVNLKLLLTYIFSICTFASWAQTSLGIGLVSIDFNDKTVLSFYTDTTEKKPIKTVEFINDKSIDSWSIRNLNTQKQWLNPETLWLDYNSFVFRCKMQAKGWYAVIVNNQTNKVYWLKKSKWTKFLSWETFLKEMFSVKRLSKQKIRSLPNANSKEVKYTGEDCFQVRSMKGDWIEIFTSDLCDDEDTKRKTEIKSGWIKWREGSKLLINYFITS